MHVVALQNNCYTDPPSFFLFYKSIVLYAKWMHIIHRNNAANMNLADFLDLLLLPVWILGIEFILINYNLGTY